MKKREKTYASFLLRKLQHTCTDTPLARTQSHSYPQLQKMLGNAVSTSDGHMPEPNIRGWITVLQGGCEQWLHHYRFANASV